MRRLVNALLVTLIVGVMAVVLALVWKIKQTPIYGVAPRAADESVAAVEATADRIALTLRRADGRERVIVLDGRSFAPIGEILAPAEQER